MAVVSMRHSTYKTEGNAACAVSVNDRKYHHGKVRSILWNWVQSRHRGAQGKAIYSVLFYFTEQTMAAAWMCIPSVSQTGADLNSECDTRPSGKKGKMYIYNYI